MVDRSLTEPASRTGGGQRRRTPAWVVLDQRPKFVERADLPAAGVEFAVSHTVLRG